MARLELAGIGRAYGSSRAVDGVDIVVPDGGFVALLGPSGCGKTTLLRLIAGFDRPSTGEIRLDDEVVSQSDWALPPERRGVGMVFQSYALWPHMSVAGNVEFALKVRGLPAAERKARVDRVLDLVGLAQYATRRPAALSGGQRQRVALARCLAMEPRVILLDEPLANLDAHLREAMQAEFRRYHRESRTTFVYVTHDQSEAMALADRIAVMDRGRVVQFADPRTIYREPATAMVVRFIGGGMALPAHAAHGSGIIEVEGCKVSARGQTGGRSKFEVCVRPPDLQLAELGSDAIGGSVTDVRYQGARSVITVATARGVDLRVEHEGEPPAIGEQIGIAIKDAWIIPG